MAGIQPTHLSVERRASSMRRDMAKPFVIALEEHYSDPTTGHRIAARTGAPAGVGGPFAQLNPLLTDVDDVRLNSMDEAGIDVQVLSHMSTALHQLDAGLAIDLAFETNDRLK